MSSSATQPGTCTFRHAATSVAEPHLAVEELNTRIGIDAANAVLLFVSADYSLERLAQILRNRVKAPILCCTTAGEISSQRGYRQGSISAATISGCHAKIFYSSDLAHGGIAVDSTLSDLCQYAQDATNHGLNHLGFLVVDGLCGKEESVIHRFQSAIPSVPIVGGSAGHSGRFKQAMVYADGKFVPDAAALLLISGNFTSIAFQTHHFVSSGVRTVATTVGADNRKLLRLDDVPARKRLAQLLGCPEETITSDWLSSRPLMIKRGDTLFVRSVAAVNGDGSLSTLCGIQKGEVLHIGRATDITDTTSSYFGALLHQRAAPDLVVGFDCILRRRELELRGRTREMNRLLRTLPFIGFSTYGEQYDGLHVNQTMTGVALWKK